jgi:putative ABC transport system ATP-binding protein
MLSARERREKIYLAIDADARAWAHAVRMLAMSQKADRLRNLVVADRLTKTIGGGERAVHIVDEASFSIPEGSLFAITGPSGSGKTTLLHLLCGIDRASSGSIVFDGEPLVATSEGALARWRGRHVGIVFQFFHLVPTLTAVENVLLALELGGVVSRSERSRRAVACLSSVGLAGLDSRLPGELSGGEQQRVAIARALANDPPLLLADEPTGNLDSKNAEGVFALLEDLSRRGKTVAYVTHDRDLASRADASIDLLDGRIVAERSEAARAGDGARP